MCAPACVRVGTQARGRVHARKGTRPLVRIVRIARIARIGRRVALRYV
jgi:hypothetical protein